MVVSSLNLGILSAIMNFIMDIFVSIIMLWINLVYAILSVVYYLIGAAFAYFADLFQAVFKALAGIGQVGYDAPSDAYLGIAEDPVLGLISNRIVINMFISLFVVAIGLMIVSVIVQMIRQEYTTEGAKNSKGEILGKAVKAFSNMIIIPVACIIGILLSNTILRLLDKATSNSSQSIGATVFIAAAYNANYMRSPAYQNSGLIDMSGTILSWFDISQFVNNSPISDYYTEDDQPVKSGWLETSYSNGGTIGSATSTCSEVADDIDYAFRNFSLFLGDNANGQNFLSFNRFDYKELSLVKQYYNFSRFNMIVFIGGEVMCAWMMLSVTIGMVMRMYKAALYFMILPPILAISPIKDAYGSWRQKFIGNILGAYGPVVGINLFFTVLPVVQQIEIFQPVGLSTIRAHGYNLIMQGIFAIVGLMMVKKFVGEVAGLIGADNALSEGEGAAKTVAKGAAMVGVAALTAGAGAAALSAKAGGAIMSGVKMKGAASLAKTGNSIKGAANLVNKNKMMNVAQSKMEDLEQKRKKGQISKKQYKKQYAEAQQSYDENKLSAEEQSSFDQYQKSNLIDKDGNLSDYASEQLNEIEKKKKEGYIVEENGQYMSAKEKRKSDNAKEKERRSKLTPEQRRKETTTKIMDKAKNVGSGLLKSSVATLNWGAQSGIKSLLKDGFHIDVDKALSNNAKGNGGLWSKAVSGIVTGTNKAFDPSAKWGWPQKNSEYGLRYNEAKSDVANRADTLVERLLQDILKTLKDNNASEKEKKNARQLGKTLAGGNEELAKKFDMDVSKLSVDKLMKKFDETDRATLKANAVDMSASQMARGQGVQDSNLLKAIEKATFKANVGSGVVNEFAQKVKSASMEAAEKIAAKSKSDSDKQVAAIKDLKDALVSAMKENNKNNSKK